MLEYDERLIVPDPARTAPFEIWWSWFTVWSGRYVRAVPPSALRSIYANPAVVTLDRLAP